MAEVQRFEVVGAGDVASVLAVLVERLGLRVDRDEDVVRVALDGDTGAVTGCGAVFEHRLAADGTAALVWVQDGWTIHRTDAVARDVPSSIAVAGLPARLTTSVGDGPLAAIGTATSRIVSLSRTDDEDKTVVRVLVDRTLDERGSSLPILLEVFPLRGYGREAARLVDEIGEVIAVRTTSTSSSDRVCPPSASVGPDPSMTAAEGWRAALRGLTAQMTAHFAGVLSGDDPEDLHAFRVAVRRIRTLLRDGVDVLSSLERDRFRSEFLWLGDVTTPARDADVHVRDHPAFVVALPVDRRDGLDPLLDVLVAHRDVVHGNLVRELRSMRRAEFGMAWAAWLDDDTRWTPDVAERAGDPVVPVAAGVARDAHRRLVKDGRAVRKSSPAVVLHDLRKDAKRLRYLLECFAPVFDPVAIATVTTRLRRLQDALGTFQDAAVQARALQGLVSDDDDLGPDTLLAIGSVIDHLDRASAGARSEVAGLFGRFDDRKVRRAMDDLDRPAKGRTR